MASLATKHLPTGGGCLCKYAHSPNTQYGMRVRPIASKRLPPGKEGRQLKRLI